MKKSNCIENENNNLHLLERERERKKTKEIYKKNEPKTIEPQFATVNFLNGTWLQSFMFHSCFNLL